MSGPEQKTEVPEVRQEVIDRVKNKTREALAKPAEFDMNNFKKELEATGAQKHEVEWALKQIQESLPESAKDPLKSPEAAALNAASQDALQNGLPKVTATEEKAKNWIEGLKKRFSGAGAAFPLVGEYFATLAEKAKTDNKTFMVGLYEKMAGWFGFETPSVKFEKFKTGLKLPDSYALGETGDNEIGVNTADGKKIATLKFSPKDGRVNLVTASGSFSYKNADELNKFLTEKLTAAPTIAQTTEKPEEKAEQDKYTKLLGDKGWTLETSRFANDIKTLKDSNVTDVEGLINQALGEKGRLTQVLAVIKETIPQFKNEMLKVSLADMLFQKMDETDFQKVLAVVKNEKDEYKFDKNPQVFRDIIDKFNSAKGTDAIAAVATTYKKQA